MGAVTPFPIQAATIPSALGGQDVLGRGKTGSGKTIAFAVPVVEKLIAAGSRPRDPGKPRALIIAPTRELADQIDRTVKGLARAAGFFTVCVYGGVPQRKQEIALDRGTDIIVATPGRLEDLMAQGIVDLSQVETMVVDEADHMCDLGFIEPVRRIMRAAGDMLRLVHVSDTMDHNRSNGLRYITNPPGNAVRIHQHLKIGDGDVNWGEFFSGLKEIGFLDNPNTVMCSSVFAENEKNKETAKYQLAKIQEMI
jgi:superfamily II DNA/RNA helicase